VKVDVFCFLKIKEKRKKEEQKMNNCNDCKECEEAKEGFCIIKVKNKTFIMQKQKKEGVVWAPKAERGSNLNRFDQCFGRIISQFNVDENISSASFITAYRTTKGIAHVEISHVRVDARLTPLSTKEDRDSLIHVSGSVYRGRNINP